MKSVFGDRLYVELQRHGLAQERAVEPQLLKLAYDLDLPLVATNESYFATRDDFEAHDALICIAEGRYVADDDRAPPDAPSTTSRPRAEMAALFADLPEALENTVEIARRCAYRPLQAQADPAAVSPAGMTDAAARRSGRAQAPVAKPGSTAHRRNTAWRRA